MKRRLTFLALAVALIGCNCPNNKNCNQSCPVNTTTPTTEVASVKEPVVLIGKKALLTYPSLKAEVQYLTDNQLHWKTTDSQGQVAEQTNALTLKAINPTQYFLSWVENDGTTVSQVIDTEKGTVTTYLTYEDKGKRLSELLEGSFELLN